MCHNVAMTAGNFAHAVNGKRSLFEYWRLTEPIKSLLAPTIGRVTD
jgi:hypothetical protein